MIKNVQSLSSEELKRLELLYRKYFLKQLALRAGDSESKLMQYYNKFQSKDHSKNVIERILEGEKISFAALDDEGGIKGFITGHETITKTGWISHIYVDGIADGFDMYYLELYRAFAEALREKGMTRILSEAVVKDSDTIGALSSVGFEEQNAVANLVEYGRPIK